MKVKIIFKKSKNRRKNQETGSHGHQHSRTELLFCAISRKRSSARAQQNDLQWTAGAHSGCGKNILRLARWTDGLQLGCIARLTASTGTLFSSQIENSFNSIQVVRRQHETLLIRQLLLSGSVIGVLPLSHFAAVTSALVVF